MPWSWPEIYPSPGPGDPPGGPGSGATAGLRSGVGPPLPDAAPIAPEAGEPHAIDLSGIGGMRRSARTRGSPCQTRAVTELAVVGAGAGELIADTTDRLVEILAEHEALHATWARFAAGR